MSGACRGSSGALLPPPKGGQFANAHVWAGRSVPAVLPEVRGCRELSDRQAQRGHRCDSHVVCVWSLAGDSGTRMSHGPLTRSHVDTLAGDGNSTLEVAGSTHPRHLWEKTQWHLGYPALQQESLLRISPAPLTQCLPLPCPAVTLESVVGHPGSLTSSGQAGLAPRVWPVSGAVTRSSGRPRTVYFYHASTDEMITVEPGLLASLPSEWTTGTLHDASSRTKWGLQPLSAEPDGVVFCSVLHWPHPRSATNRDQPGRFSPSDRWWPEIPTPVTRGAWVAWKGGVASLAKDFLSCRRVDILWLLQFSCFQ